MSNYYVLGKTKDMNRFKAINLIDGCFVSKIIEASVFWNKTAEDMKRIVSKLQERNPEFEFKFKELD